MNERFARGAGPVASGKFQLLFLRPGFTRTAGFMFLLALNRVSVQRRTGHFGKATSKKAHKRVV